MRRADGVLLAVVGLLVVLAVVAAVVGPQGTALDASSPEGTVQRYLQALADDDPLAAADLLAEPGCDVDDVAAAWVPPGLSADLLDSEVDAATAVVRVQVTELHDTGPLGSGGYSHPERFVLERSGGAWRITGSPWPLGGCEVVR